VRSTVLGGEVLTELEPANNHDRSFVYAGGAVLATLESYGGPGFVWWEPEPMPCKNAGREVKSRFH
jgi:hypothetical protein